MVSSAAKSVDEYLDSLPAERRIVVGAVRDVVRRNLPKGFSETMGHGMIAYNIPLERYPETYNGQPLCYAAIAAQKETAAKTRVTSATRPASTRPAAEKRGTSAKRR